MIRNGGKEFRGVGKEGTGREGLRVMRKGGKGFRAWKPSVDRDTKYSIVTPAVYSRLVVNYDFS